MTPIHLAEASQSLAQLRSLTDGGVRLDQAAGATEGVPFANWLQDAITTYETQAWAADRAGKDFATGALDDIHGTMIASKEAEIELRVIANVRNKLVDAFNDLMRMSV